MLLTDEIGLEAVTAVLACGEEGNVEHEDEFSNYSVFDIMMYMYHTHTHTHIHAGKKREKRRRKKNHCVYH